MTDIRHWQSMTTPEVAALVERDPVVILPLAAVEQHGPHLPLSTDLDIGTGVLASAFHHLPSNFPAWVLPAQMVGASTEHVRFPGTLSLDPEVLRTVICEYGRAVARAGVRRLVLHNSHGGNISAMDTAAKMLRQECGLLVVKSSYFLFPRPDVDFPETEWRHGLHGGAVETAMMLHLRPDLVRDQAIRDSPSLGQALEGLLRRVGPETEGASFAWLADDLSESGVTGDARRATSQIGHQLVVHYGAALADVIRDTHDFPLERLVSR